MASLYFTPSVLAVAPLGKGSLDYMLQPNDLNRRKKNEHRGALLWGQNEVRALWSGAGPCWELVGTSFCFAKTLHAHKDLTSIWESPAPPSQPNVNWVESKLLYMGYKLHALGKFLPISSSGKMYEWGSHIYLSKENAVSFFGRKLKLFSEFQQKNKILNKVLAA